MRHVFGAVALAIAITGCGGLFGPSDSRAPAGGSSGGAGGGTGGGTSSSLDGLMQDSSGKPVACNGDQGCWVTNSTEPSGRCPCNYDGAICSSGQCTCKRPNRDAAASCSDSCACASGACAKNARACCPAKGTGASGTPCHSDCECVSLSCQSNNYCL